MNGTQKQGSKAFLRERVRVAQVGLVVIAVLLWPLGRRWFGEGDVPAWGITVLVVLGVVSLALAVWVETRILRVGPTSVRWRDNRLRVIEVPFDRVAQLRGRTRHQRVELVTTDGAVHALPVSPHFGPDVARRVLGTAHFPIVDEPRR